MLATEAKTVADQVNRGKRAAIDLDQIMGLVYARIKEAAEAGDLCTTLTEKELNLVNSLYVIKDEIEDQLDKKGYKIWGVPGTRMITVSWKDLRNG